MTTRSSLSALGSLFTAEHTGRTCGVVGPDNIIQPVVIERPARVASGPRVMAEAPARCMVQVDVAIVEIGGPFVSRHLMPGAVIVPSNRRKRTRRVATHQPRHHVFDAPRCGPTRTPPPAYVHGPWRDLLLLAVDGCPLLQDRTTLTLPSLAQYLSEGGFHGVAYLLHQRRVTGCVAIQLLRWNPDRSRLTLNRYRRLTGRAVIWSHHVSHVPTAPRWTSTRPKSFAGIITIG